MISSKTSDVFLALVRLGIGHPVSGLPDTIDWSEIKALAERHGLSAVVLDGIDKLNTNSINSTNGLSPLQKLEWIGEVLQNYETRYRQYEVAIGSLAGWYNQHGYKMMVLKGYACAMNWPRPEHRPSGDIDIWQFGQYREADVLLELKKGVKVDSSQHHHTVFDWNGFMVENHYDFINVHHHKSNVEFEAILKELAKDDSYYVEVNGAKVFLPSPDLHALFILKHNMAHFASEGMNLRQLLDWAFFVKKQGEVVEWGRIMAILKEYGMLPAFELFNAICIEDLGFEDNLFPKSIVNQDIKNRVINDMLEKEYGHGLPKNLLGRIHFKLKRWRTSKWKHKLCYKESMWSAFWSGVLNHLLKPSSI